MSLAAETVPHFGAHAAEFVEGNENAYALIGEVLHVSEGLDPATHHLLVGQGVTRPIDEDLLPLFEFLATPREQRQVQDWLDWGGAPAGFLDHLVKLGLVARVDARTAATAAKSLKGLRLAPQSTPGEPTKGGYISLMSQESERPVMYVSPELAGVLWRNDHGYDIPAAIRTLAKITREDKSLTAQKVLTAVPMLLEYGYARLEWVRVRNT